MANNSNLAAARKKKDDEFYTQLTDIEKELKNYKAQFKDKIVLCNCDDPTWSNFWKYFELNFEVLGLKKLISTHYASSTLFETSPSYKLEISSTTSGKAGKAKKSKLNGDGSFNSAECVALMEEADIIVTNPPFSLFRDFFAQLIDMKKKFLIIGPEGAVIYKDVFPLLQSNKVWFGTGNVKKFIKPDGSNKTLGNVNWFTNLPHKKRNELLVMTAKYKKSNYPKYDNFDAIEVSEVKDIPQDYTGWMGVPTSFFGKYNPEQFEIIGITRGWSELKTKDYPHQIQIGGKSNNKLVSKLNDGTSLKIDAPLHGKVCYKIDNQYFRQTYPRVIIRNKQV